MFFPNYSSKFWTVHSFVSIVCRYGIFVGHRSFINSNLVYWKNWTSNKFSRQYTVVSRVVHRRATIVRPDAGAISVSIALFTCPSHSLSNYCNYPGHWFGHEWHLLKGYLINKIRFNKVIPVHGKRHALISDTWELGCLRVIICICSKRIGSFEHEVNLGDEVFEAVPRRTLLSLVNSQSFIQEWAKSLATSTSAQIKCLILLIR